MRRARLVVARARSAHGQHWDALRFSQLASLVHLKLVHHASLRPRTPALMAGQESPRLVPALPIGVVRATAPLGVRGMRLWRSSYEATAVGCAPCDRLDSLAVHQETTALGVSAAAVVLGGGEHCQHFGTLAHSDAIRGCFVGPHDVRQAVLLEKIKHGAVAEHHRAAAPRALPEAGARAVLHQRLLLRIGRVRPEQRERQRVLLVFVVLARVLDVDRARDALDLDNSPVGSALGRIPAFFSNGARDTAVHAEDASVNNAGEWEAVKGPVAPFPHFKAFLVAEPGLALRDETPLAVKALPAVHRPRFVVAADHEDLIRMQQFLREQVGHELDAVRATVHVVPEEEKLSGSQVHAHRPDVVRKELQVLQVAVQVAEDVHWRLELENARLGRELLRGAFTEVDEAIGKVLGLEVVGAADERLRPDQVGHALHEILVVSCLAAAVRGTGQPRELLAGGDAGRPSESHLEHLLLPVHGVQGGRQHCSGLLLSESLVLV
eukprot:CAMPEP_0202051872 /NCGR_PEP_ID=MMETSP0963-20130614/4903_1 /ASSEMBLY_ACC=CAM_ASM_000494 /TAXON_ID=4773 /ORGANISM="Schizochytrium aggregatum, Strain ATCC28209" /LENGTH=493 /DNA_ID=CAMNT_0048617085 /DNA_START=229 /DNA_END=1710 /DNA_ORIENTATION=+